VLEKGFCWGFTENLTLDSNKTLVPGSSNSFSCTLTNLESNKDIYACAYAVNRYGVSYGKPVQFYTAKPPIPDVTISEASQVTSSSGNFEVTMDDRFPLAEFDRGICWATSPNPTIRNNKKILGSNLRSYTSTLNDLDINTTYYVRAFNTCSAGTLYSNQVVFSTTKAIKILSCEPGETTAICSIEVLDPRINQISSMGVCWSSSHLPTINNSKTSHPFTTVKTSEQLTGLQSYEKYFVRPYITFGSVVQYGDQVIVSPGAKVTDIDGNVYQTVKIGSQIWMASNLKVTKFRDGKAINFSIDPFNWNNMSQFYGVYCNINDNPGNNTTYGRLYNWLAVSDASKLAPVGWHIPSESEWETLRANIGSFGSLMSVSGNWEDFSETIDNSTGFSAEPGGFKDVSGYNEDFGRAARFWSSTKAPQEFKAHTFSITDPSLAYYELESFGVGLNVRCIRD